MTETQDHQAEKTLKKLDEKNKEALLVAGGKHLRDRVVHQIVGGKVMKIGGNVVALDDIQTLSSSSGDSSHKRSKTGDNALLDLMLELESKTVELDIELHQEEQHFAAEE